MENVEELQTVFNEDSIELLVEDGTVENVATVETDNEEVANNGNENI